MFPTGWPLLPLKPVVPEGQLFIVFLLKRRYICNTSTHIYVLIYDILFSLSDLLQSVGHSLGPSMSL